MLGAVEVVRDAVWHRNVVAGRNQRGATCLAREGTGPVVSKAEAVNWTSLLTNSTYVPKPGAQHCEEWRTFSVFFLVFLFAACRRMASRFYPTPCEMNVKRGSKPTAELTKNRRKT
jgi:hypothetical protein